MTTWPAHGMSPERWAAWLGVEMVRPGPGAALIEQVRRDLALMLTAARDADTLKVDSQQ